MPHEPIMAPHIRAVRDLTRGTAAPILRAGPALEGDTVLATIYRGRGYSSLLGAVDVPPRRSRRKEAFTSRTAVISCIFFQLPGLTRVVGVGVCLLSSI